VIAEEVKVRIRRLHFAEGWPVGTIAAQLERGDFKTRPFFDSSWLRTITHIPAGRALNVLAGLVGEGAPAANWRRIDEAVRRTEETDLVVDLSFFPGAFGDRGRIENIREDNFSLGQLFLAAWQSMARNYAAAAERIFPDRRWGSLAFSGGVANASPRLRDLIAGALDRPYRMGSPDDTLLGLGTLATALEQRDHSVASAVDKVAALRTIA
jgi:hypothetical protein